MTSLPFVEIEAEFNARTRRIVWCTVATVDSKGRPRNRILHPIWEGTTGWIATGRQSLKTKHLANNPNVSLLYWDPAQQNVQIEATADWEDDAAERRRVWELYKAAPPPLGYDIGDFFPGGPDGGGWGLLKITPCRIELSGMADSAAGLPLRRVWRRGEAE
jgi:general stress protein 26